MAQGAKSVLHLHMCICYVCVLNLFCSVTSCHVTCPNRPEATYVTKFWREFYAPKLIEQIHKNINIHKSHTMHYFTLAISLITTHCTTLITVTLYYIAGGVKMR